MIDIKQNMLWPTMLFEMTMPDYDSIKEELVEYIRTCKVEETDNSGIGPFDQRHKKFLDESYPTLFNNNDNESFNSVKDFCMNMTLEVAKNINSPHIETSDWLIRPTDAWYHITKDRGYHDSHTHALSPWCGIFYVDKGDTVIIISASGKSKNLLEAAKICKRKKIFLCTLTGFNKSNPLRKLGNINLWANSMGYNVVENIHQIWLLSIVDRIIGKVEYSA